MQSSARGVARSMSRVSLFFSLNHPLLAAAFAAGVLAATPVRAQTSPPLEEEAPLINWWYSAAFGTGFYKIGAATATVLRVPLSRRFQEGNDEQWGLSFIAPVSIAVYRLNLNELDQINLREDVAAASVLPGVEAEIKLDERWRIKPFAQAGVGTEFSDSSLLAYIYYGGVKSLYRFPESEYRLSLGTALALAGYRLRDGSESQTIGVFQVGLNTETPWRLELLDRSARFGVHLIATTYFSRFAFANPEPGKLVVRNEYEIGFDFRAARPYEVLGFDVATLGLGFRFASNVRGINFYTEFPF